MLPSFANRTVTVTRAPLIDSRGSKIRDWTNAESFEVSGCSFQPVSMSLNIEERENVRADAVLYAPLDADIKAADRITYFGNVYSVMGNPMIWESPTGAVSHLQIDLEAWNG